MYIPTNYNQDKKIIIFSGAGLDAPSGVQTFRGTNGMWNDHKVEDICNQKTWKENFAEVHKFYNHRRTELSEVEPNNAHKVIKNIIEKYGEDNVYNITMNVSDFFERLETPVLHLHGELTKMECDDCGDSWDIGYKAFNIDKDTCPSCKQASGVRPKIVFFNGPAPMYQYYKRALEALNNKDSIIVVIGTQGNVIPISYEIADKECYKILCNTESEKYIDDYDFDDVYFESIETAIDKIEKDIQEFWK